MEFFKLFIKAVSDIFEKLFKQVKFGTPISNFLDIFFAIVIFFGIIVAHTQYSKPIVCNVSTI